MDTVSPRPQSIGVKITIARQVIPAHTIESIPEVLKHVRKNNISGEPRTQGEVAKLLGVPQITYRSWEGGHRQPSAAAMTDLETYVKTNLSTDAKLIANGKAAAEPTLPKSKLAGIKKTPAKAGPKLLNAKLKQVAGRGKRPAKTPLLKALSEPKAKPMTPPKPAKAKAAPKKNLDEINRKIAAAIKGETPAKKAVKKPKSPK